MPLTVLGPDYRVLLVDTAGTPLSVGGGTQYADGAIQATPTGNVVMWLDAGTVRAVSAAKPLPVAIISGAGGSQTDASAWTTAVTSFAPGGGVFNDSAAALTSGQQGTLRMTAQRGQHVNLRNNAGTKVGGISNNGAAPVALTQLGVLPAIASAAVQTWTEGRQVLQSVNLNGAALTGFLGTGSTIRSWTASNSVTNSAGDDVPGIGPLNYDVLNSKWHRQRDVTSSDNSSGAGLLGAGVVGWDGTVYRRLGASATGVLYAGGSVAHDGVDAGNPLKLGARAIAHGTNPTAVAAADRTDLFANRAGVLFVMGGHPNLQTLRFTTTAAETNTKLVTISTGLKIVVTRVMVACSKANTVNVSVVIGFHTTTTPTTTSVVAAHPGIDPGGGFAGGGGGAMMGVGADDEDLMLTSSVPTGGRLDVCVSYFTIES